MTLDLRFLGLVLCFTLSGAAGLLYQTAWTQQFAFVFGTSELAVVAVLAAYMAGLALGAAAAARFERRLQRPLRVYAFLELGIGLAACAVATAVDAAGWLHSAVAGARETLPHAASTGAALYYLGSSFLILLIPTALMGATLPLAARYAVAEQAQIGPRVGLLYTANTAGAAFGTLVAGFLLLPALDLGATILIGAGTNLLVCLCALGLDRGSVGGPLPVASNAAKTDPGGAPPLPKYHWVLPLVFVSGWVSFTYEVLWTRLLTHLLGGSVYAFALMLGTFLGGLALGAGLASRLASSQERARQGFALAQLAAAVAAVAALVAVDPLPALPAESTPGRQPSLFLLSALSAAVLLPLTVALGATFPFAVRILARQAASAAGASARVFAWNTVGAIAGALLAGYVLLPALRFAGTVSVAAAVSLILAATTVLVLRPRHSLLGGVCLVLLLGLGLGSRFGWPPTPWNVLRHSPMGGRPYPGEVAFFAVGRSSTVLLFERPGIWRLTTNGLPESAIEAPGVRSGRLATPRWLALLPLAVRPATRSLLVVGLGAGATVEEIPASIEEVHVVELEPEVIRANRHMAGARRQDPLADPRLRLYTNDARSALRLTNRRFDAIVSQPSHPWTAGASHLFTREFFSLVKDRLTPAGVFVQWMGLAFVDAELLHSLVATAVDVFPVVEVYSPMPGSVLILGSQRPLDLMATAPAGLAAARREWARIGVLCREDLVAAQVLDAGGARRFVRGAAVITDSRNLLRTGSARALREPLGTAALETILGPFEPVVSNTDGLDRLYLVRRWIRGGRVGRARRLAVRLPLGVERHTALGLVEAARGRRHLSEQWLRRALRLDPSSTEALHGLARYYESDLGSGSAVPSFLTPLMQDPETAPVLLGWRLLAAEDWSGLAGLEERLAKVDPKHPGFPAAVRLRAEWRIRSGREASGHEALDLIDVWLLPRRPQDLVLRARAAVLAQVPEVALASLGEAAPHLARRPALAEEARALLESLPDGGDEAWRRQLLFRLRGE